MPYSALVAILNCFNTIMADVSVLEAIFEAHVPSGRITVIEDRDRRRWSAFRNDSATETLAGLAARQRWVFETYNSDAERVTPDQQRKQPSHRAVVILLNDLSKIYHVVDFVRSKRIVGPVTRAVLVVYGVSKGVVKKLLRLVERKLKIWRACLVSDGGRIFEYRGSLQEAQVSQLFRDRDLKGSSITMRALWFEDGIYAFFNQDLSFDGVCIQIVETIARSLNMTVQTEFLVTAENSYRPFGFDGDFGGFLGVLHRQEADLVCGSISLFEMRHHVSDALPSFTQEALKWIVSTNGPIRGWKRLILEFSDTVWICTFAAWFASVAVLYADHRLHQRGDFSKMAAHLVGATLEISFIKHLGGSRVFLCAFLVYAMIMTSAYKSGLTSLLTWPIMEEKISTVEEGLDEDRTVFVLPSWEDIIESWTDLKDATTLWDVDFRGRYEIMGSSLESLQRMRGNQSVMTLMPEDEADSLIIKYFMSIDGLRAFYYLPERFINYPKVICMAPGHPLYPIFATKQHQIIEAGLIDMWFAKFFHQELIRAIYHSTDIFEGTEAVPLAVHHLSGLFNAFLCGLLFSFLIFLAEKLYRVCFNKVIDT